MIWAGVALAEGMVLKLVGSTATRLAGHSSDEFRTLRQSYSCRPWPSARYQHRSSLADSYGQRLGHEEGRVLWRDGSMARSR